MNDRERRIIDKANLAAMGPADAMNLLENVTGTLRSMLIHGRVREVDAILEAMSPNASRFVALSALGDIDRPQSSADLVELLVRHEADYERALEHELQGDGPARARAVELACEVEQTLTERERDRAFLARRIAARRRCDEA